MIERARPVGQASAESTSSFVKEEGETQSTRGRVKHALADARAAMNEIFDRRCVLVSKKGVCHQCSEIQGFVNPKRDARAAALELDLVRAAENGHDAARLLELRTELVRSLDPLHSPGSELHSYLLSLMEEHA